MAKVRVGVIGIGSMGDHHARIYSTLKEACFIGVFDSDQSRAVEVAQKYSVKPFESLEQLFKEVDAVSLASPTSTHYQIALNCLSHGVHTLVEKPLSPLLSEAEELVVLAHKNKLVLAVGMIERFNPAFKKLRAIVKHEYILGMDFKRYSPFPQRISDASVVPDMMLHDIDLALALSPSSVDSVISSGQKVQSDRPDECQATIYFKDGLIAKLEASRVQSDKKRFAVITTDKAIYEADLLNRWLFQRPFDSLSSKNSIELPSDDQLSAELKDFLHAVDRGREPMIPGSAALPAIKIVEEVERSIC